MNSPDEQEVEISVDELSGVETETSEKPDSGVAKSIDDNEVSQKTFPARIGNWADNHLGWSIAIFVLLFTLPFSIPVASMLIDYEGFLEKQAAFDAKSEAGNAFGNTMMETQCVRAIKKEVNDDSYGITVTGWETSPVGEASWIKKISIPRGTEYASEGFFDASLNITADGSFDGGEVIEYVCNSQDELGNIVEIVEK